MSKIEKMNEEQLEDVTGGEPEGGFEWTKDKNCYFEPDQPFEWRRNGGGIQVKCKSKCHTMFIIGKVCSCHGTVSCVDRWHDIMEVSPGHWSPRPAAEHNHSDPRKQMNGLHPY